MKFGIPKTDWLAHTLVPCKDLVPIYPISQRRLRLVSRLTGQAPKNTCFQDNFGPSLIGCICNAEGPAIR